MRTLVETVTTNPVNIIPMRLINTIVSYHIIVVPHRYSYHTKF